MNKRITIKFAKIKIQDQEHIVCMTYRHDVNMTTTVFDRIQKQYAEILTKIQDLNRYAKKHNIEFMNFSQMLMNDLENLLK